MPDSVWLDMLQLAQVSASAARPSGENGQFGHKVINATVGGGL
jgi:hypothetical protein